MYSLHPEFKFHYPFNAAKDLLINLLIVGALEVVIIFFLSLWKWLEKC